MKSPASSGSKLPYLRPGDILLYNEPRSFIDWAIRLRTWSDVAHVEIYLGNGMSAASRNGQGVQRYPIRYHGLVQVRRPAVPFNLEAAEDYVKKMCGTPYGWADLLRFYLVDVPTKGVICSTFADLVLMFGGIHLFAYDYAASVVSPRDFQITPAAVTIWPR